MNNTEYIYIISPFPFHSFEWGYDVIWDSQMRHRHVPHVQPAAVITASCDFPHIGQVNTAIDGIP